jgi:hypothetical protein
MSEPAGVAAPDGLFPHASRERGRGVPARTVIG